MSNQEREEYITQLLELQFEDDANYTREELTQMDDDELATAYDEECFEDDASEASGPEDEEEECYVCGEMRVCEAVAEIEGEDQPICDECAAELEEDDTAEDTTEIVDVQPVSEDDTEEEDEEETEEETHD